jgi:hypothetical protein
MGRRRPEGQERGLRPLYPVLPGRWFSRALRIAMPAARWSQFDALVSGFSAETGARAAGRALEALLQRSAAARATDWLDWERDKARRLLVAAGRAA